MCYFKTIQFWAITSIKIRIKIVQYINELLLENIEHKRFSIFKIYFSKRKFFQTVYKTTASQNVERKHISSTIVHPSLDVVHRISRGLPNDIDFFVFCVILPVSQPHHRT